MKDINLLSEHGVKKSKKYKDPIRGILIVLIFVTAIGMGGYCGYLYNQTQNYIAIYNESTLKINKYEEVIQIKEELSATNNAIEKLSDILIQVSQNEVYNSELFQIMAMAMPTELTLVSYSISADGAIELSGQATSSDAVAYFAYKLQEKRNFRKVDIKNVSIINAEVGQSAQFSISIQI